MDREREHRQPARLAVVDVPRRGRRLGGPGDVDRRPLRAGTRSAPRDADPPVPGCGRGGAAHRGGPTPGRVDGRPVPGLPGRHVRRGELVGRADRAVGHRRSGHQQRGAPLPGPRRPAPGGGPRRGDRRRHRRADRRNDPVGDPGVAGRPPAGAARRQAGQGRAAPGRGGRLHRAGHPARPANEGERHTVEKVVALYTSRDRAISEPGRAARDKARRAPDLSDLLARHVLAWDHLWERCDLRISGHERADRVLHLHLFQLLQTLSAHSVDLDVGIPARGLHGEAYRGHIFWDDDFVFPYLNLRMPELSRALLLYRWRRLPQAREAAREIGCRGAMFPWQSGSNGREETQTLHLNPRSGRWTRDNSHLQRHINAVDRLQHLAVLRGDRRHRFPRPARRGDHLRGREVLVEPGQLRPRRRPVRPARGDGTRRVPRRLPVAGRSRGWTTTPTPT